MANENSVPLEGAQREAFEALRRQLLDWIDGQLKQPRLCCLCRCERTADVYGLPVCDYHVTNTEDDPPCPTCYPAQPQLDPEVERILQEEEEIERRTKARQEAELPEYIQHQIVVLDNAKVRLFQASRRRVKTMPWDGEEYLALIEDTQKIMADLHEEWTTNYIREMDLAVCPECDADHTQGHGHLLTCSRSRTIICPDCRNGVPKANPFSTTHHAPGCSYNSHTTWKVRGS